MPLCRGQRGSRRNCDNALDWPWSGAYARLHGNNRLTLAAWPVDRPRNWTALLNDPMDRPESDMIRTSVARGRPLGDAQWTRQIADRLGLGFTLRSARRPRKNDENQ